jgi:SAM-dependent methyltransferase
MMSDGWKTRVPWQVKVASKIVLSRLPVPYGVWSRLNMFKHGFMKDPAYAERVFLEHFRQLDPAVAARGFTCLELGPGDSLLSALVAKKYGARKTYLVDVGAFADTDIETYRQAARALFPGTTPSSPGVGALSADAWINTDDMLEACDAEYLTQGVASLATLETGSVDFIWSQAVLEHVRRHEFAALLRETRRVLRPGGTASHRVDLRDHLGGRLNNLRFSEQLWESKLFADSGFYTNRLRFSEIVEIARDAGFVVRSTRCDEWPELPTNRNAMAKQFHRFDDADLRVQGFFLTIDPA